VCQPSPGTVSPISWDTVARQAELMWKPSPGPAQHVFPPFRQLFGNFFLSSCARDQAVGQHPSTQGTGPAPRRHGAAFQGDS
jgi:hypothetical protein